MAFLSANLSTLLIAAGLLALVIVIITVLIRNRRKGKSSCGCSCSGCPMSGSCHNKQQAQRNDNGV